MEIEKAPVEIQKAMEFKIDLIVWKLLTKSL